eukprot:COSAG04_NODE_88_length_27314_cov_6.056476_10_plen_648_part_00
MRFFIAATALATAACAAGRYELDGTSPMEQLHGLMQDPDRLRQLAYDLLPAEVAARHSGAPEWTKQSEDERSALLQHHLDGRHGRRLQWAFGDADAQAREDSLASALADEVSPDAPCDDPLASNAGASAVCEYDCESLRQEYFPNDSAAARCFLYDPSTQSWPAELLDLRAQRLETKVFADGTNPQGDVEFTVGEGRTCTDITIVSSFDQGTHTEHVCLVDGQHEYNHTITDEHSVEVVGYAESGVHDGAGGQTSFVVGECTDVLIRVTTTSVGGGSNTWSLDDGGHHGPWTFETEGGVGVYERESCMFDNEFTVSRQGAASWQGSVEIVGFIRYRNTITIPNNENWIVQGATDPGTGLPVALDARLSSGTTLDRSHANIVLRHLRISGQTAPLDPHPELVGRGGWFGGQTGTYGGAFRYEGGTSDHQNPVRLIFDTIIFDHNSAVSGGAVFINGRAGFSTPDSSVQNWDSGVAATWTRCIFFRNFAALNSGGVLSTNVWPMTFEFGDSAFIQNTVGLQGSDESYYWDSLYGEVVNVRAGVAALRHSGTRFVGGWKTDGLMSGIVLISMFEITAVADEPDARWDLAYDDTSWSDYMLPLVPAPIIGAGLPNLNVLVRIDAHLSDVSLTDLVGIAPGSVWDSIYGPIY